MEIQTLNHSTLTCNYHEVWIHKYRKRKISKAIRVDFGAVPHKLAEHREINIFECCLPAEHVHMLMSIPQKCYVSSAIVYIKGKSALYIARQYNGRKRNFGGKNFWTRGFYVSPAGLDEETIRNRTRHQEEEDKRIDQLSLVWESAFRRLMRFQTALSGSRYLKPMALLGGSDAAIALNSDCQPLSLGISISYGTESRCPALGPP